MSDNGVLDVVVKLKKRSKLNGGKRFAFREAKGGLNTRLGEATAKKYSFINGELRFVTQTRRAPIRQASEEWYYQKFAEIYAMGQRVGGATGKNMQGLANEIFDAARKGEIAARVATSNVNLDRKFIDSTADVVAYFASQKWDLSKGFPSSSSALVGADESGRYCTVQRVGDALHSIAVIPLLVMRTPIEDLGHGHLEQHRTNLHPTPEGSAADDT